MKNRFVLNLFLAVAPVVTWIVAALLPGRRASVAATECRNKGRVMTLVRRAKSHIDPEGREPLERVLERCYAHGSYVTVWALEGAGLDLAEWHMERDPNMTRLLTDYRFDPPWDRTLLMLNAGMGMYVAGYALQGMGARPPDPDLRRAVVRAVDLCRANARPGYYGAAVEVLGLMFRFFGNARFCRRSGDFLADYAPDSVGYFWRGVGRSFYFHVMNFVPSASRPCRAVSLCQKEAPSLELREGLYAGVAWALTLINIEHPEVMAWVLKQDDVFTRSPGFINGVMSSAVMWQETTPDDAWLRQFMNYQPDPADRGLGQLWESKIKAPIQTALQVIHPVLKKHNRLDEVFRCQSLPDLAAKLEKGADPLRRTSS